MLAVSCVLAGLASDPLGAQAPPANQTVAEMRKSYEGDWRGQLTCGGEVKPIALTLNLTANPMAGTLGIGDTAAYEITARLDAIGITIAPGAWIKRPEGLEAIGFRARLYHGGATLTGKVEAPGCKGSFEAKRADTVVASVPAPDPDPLALAEREVEAARLRDAELTRALAEDAVARKLREENEAGRRRLEAQGRERAAREAERKARAAEVAMANAEEAKRRAVAEQQKAQQEAEPAARPENIIVEDTGLMTSTVNKDVPCTSADHPVIFDAVAGEDKYFSPLFSYVLAAQASEVCGFRPGSRIYFVYRVRGTDVARGSAVTAENDGWDPDMSLEKLADSPPETPFAALVREVGLSDTRFRPRLEALYAETADPAEQGRMALTLSGLDDRSAGAQDRRRAYLETAAAAGHPAAMYLLAGALVEPIYQITASAGAADPGVDRSSAVALLREMASTEPGHMLFASAEAGYAPALYALARAKAGGYELSRSGAKLSATPSVKEIESAILAMYNERTPPWYSALGIKQCDATWCYAPAGNRYRIVVRDMSCQATAANAATCSVDATFNMHNTLVGDDFWGQYVVKGVTRPPIRFTATLQRQVDIWEMQKITPR